MNDKLTLEQKNFIYDNDICNSRLIACAGSGKTKCIILRMAHLLSKNINNILMLTFSRFTRDDFLNKIKHHNINNISQSYVKTIDSFAKYVIDVNNNIDVSLLSYNLLKYLDNNDNQTLIKNNKLNNIKSIFIDEAQDLNYTQYKIFVLLSDKLNIKICMIGDPNQTIYQFRGSNSKYMMDFHVDKVFYLTKNFRSQQQIIEFSKYLRPLNDIPIIPLHKQGKCLPIFYFHKNEKELGNYLLNIIRTAEKNNIDLSEIAILSPTRGYMHDSGHSYGLCLISNILYDNKIPFNQFYEESTDIIEDHVNYKPKKGKINLLTYMGSKGLEWKYVVLIDADICLINKRQFGIIKHKNDQYLLYVSCSRSIKNTIIFSHYKMKNGQIEYNINPWFSLIPKKYYTTETQFSNFKFPSLKKIETNTSEKFLSKFIDQLDNKIIEQLADTCKYTISKNKLYDVSSLNNIQLNIFAHQYIKNLIYCFHSIIWRLNKPRYYIIEKLIKIKHIITNVSYNIIKWFIDHPDITWTNYDKLKNIDNDVKKFINKLSRTDELYTYTMANNGFYNTFVLSELDYIKKKYTAYLKCNDLYKIKNLVFYITLFVYSIKTQHYFHIAERGKRFKYIIDLPIYDKIINILYKKKYKAFNVTIEQFNLKTEIDLLDDNNIIYEIKSNNDITLKQIVYQICCYLMMNNKHQKILHFINVIKGEHIEIILEDNVIEYIEKILFKN